MAITRIPMPPRIHRLPQSKYIDAVRWLPQLSLLYKLAVLATYDTDANSPSLETYSISLPTSLTPHSQWTPPTRISSLSTSHQSLVATSTLSGYLHVLSSVIQVLLSVDENNRFHVGPISGVDLTGRECVSVGEDGRVNLVSVMGSGEFKKFYDGNGLVRFNCVKWASPTEFVTNGFGYGLQWWDLRRVGSGGPVCNSWGILGE